MAFCQYPTGIASEVSTVGGRTCKDYHLPGICRLLEKKGAKFPPRPETPETPIEPESLSRPYIEAEELIAQDSKIPLMKLKIPSRDEKKASTFADLLAAVSKASGYTIICEDFLSHKPPDLVRGTRLESIAGREVILGYALSWVRGSDYPSGVSWQRIPLTWYVDERKKLIVGQSSHWAENHKYLAPEPVVAKLRSKMENDGLDVDDLEPLVHLTSEQSAEWIRDNVGLAPLRHTATTMSLWRLYYALPKTERVRVLSGKKVSLVKADPEIVRETFQRRRISLTGGSSSKNPSVPLSETDPFYDYQKVTDLTVRATRHNMRVGKGYNYELSLEWNKDGKTVKVGEYLTGPFPIRSTEPKDGLKKEEPATRAR